MRKLPMPPMEVEPMELYTLTVPSLPTNMVMATRDRKFSISRSKSGFGCPLSSRKSVMATE